MIIDLGEYVEYVFWQHRKVSLPGIGTITVNHYSAHFEKGKTEIHPPRTEFAFLPNDFKEDHLAIQVSQSEDIPLDVAKASINKYAEKVLNTLLNYGIVKIAKLGYLQKEDGKTIFTPSKQTMARSKKGLKPLQIKPVKKKSIVSTPPLVSTAITMKEDNFIEDLKDYFAAFLLAGIMFLAFYYFMNPFGDKQNDRTADQQNISHEYTEERQVKSQTVFKSFDSEQIDHDSDDQEIYSAPAKTNEEKKHDQKQIKPEKEKADAQRSIKEDDGAKNLDNDLSYQSIYNIMNENKGDRYKIKIAEPKDDQSCIILVGVYTENFAALAMEDKVKAAGYSTYRDETHDTHRVGVKFRCADHKPEKMIAKIRKRFGTQAHYLNPQLSI